MDNHNMKQFFKKYYKFLILIFLLLVSNVFLYVKKNTNVLSKLGYKVFVQTEDDSEDYEEYDGYDFPLDGYVLKDYECDNDGEITQNEKNKKITFTGEVDSCSLYFNIDSGEAKKTLKKMHTLNESIAVESGDINFLYSSDGDRIAVESFDYDESNNESFVLRAEHYDEFISNGIYEDEDEDGPTYYWRGDVDNNYLMFAGYAWRIVRINGDGTLRIVYDGMQPGDKGDIGMSKWTNKENDNGYIGYMYGNFETPSNCSKDSNTDEYTCESGGSTSYAQAHDNKNSSLIKTYLENWYEKNLINYDEYIADEVFCNAREIKTVAKAKQEYKKLYKYQPLTEEGVPHFLLKKNGKGYGADTTFYNSIMYEATDLLLPREYLNDDLNEISNELKPSFICKQSNDKLTVDNDKGQKVLKYPIGLITFDELKFASSLQYNIFPKGSYNSYLNIPTVTMTSFAGIAPIVINYVQIAANNDKYSSSSDSFGTTISSNGLYNDYVENDSSISFLAYNLASLAFICMHHSDYGAFANGTTLTLGNACDEKFAIYPMAPVINLKKDVVDTMTGTGTKNDPFIVHAVPINQESYTSDDTLEKLQDLSGDYEVRNGTPNFANVSPSTYTTYIDTSTFSGTSSTNSSVRNQYFTYSSSYTFNETTGKFSLTNPSTIRFNSSTNANTLKNKYIVSTSGTSSNTTQSYTDLDKIYKVTNASYSGSLIVSASITTIPSSKSTALHIDCSECGVWKAQDDYGDSYYVRGLYDYNYLKFGKDSSNNDLYWRILRVNGDGTLRLVYDGTSAEAKSTVGEITSDSSSDTYDEVLNGWYINNLLNTPYERYLSDSIFCKDYSTTGSGNTLNYNSYTRNVTSNVPVLTCSQKADRYTITDSIKGNMKTFLPVGGITVDEAAMAGFKFGSSNPVGDGNYLDKGVTYWTITPLSKSGDTQNNGQIASNYIDSADASSKSGYIVPVINIEASAVQNMTGSGTKTDPFVIDPN